jgi:hypothetical protein
MKWLLAFAIVALCSVDARAQCYWDVRYNTCPTPPAIGGGLPAHIPIINAPRSGVSQDMLSDTLLLDYWLKRNARK